MASVSSSWHRSSCPGPRGAQMGPDVGAEVRAAQPGEQLGGVHAPEAGEAQHRPALPVAQEVEMVPQPPQLLEEAPGVRVARQSGLLQQPGRLLRQLQAVNEGHVLHGGR